MKLGSHTVTVVRPAGQDPLGDPLPGSAETTVGGCFVQPRTSTEATDLRDTVITGLIAFLPPGTDVRATDKIRFNGVLYAVDGDPDAWDVLSGRAHHVEVALRRVEG
ncbi:hypothetical protein NE236_41355 [Actinoallomurus purpureus]|uniref:hypothetical protein n=1 Tax=Actinoallomurus purpureus TaxID=478114 RepID=UPI0020927F70|nr:hypothetical protein [Actinoallomurus purpureus]MCO6011417.1 hypothetical protein [Actinoallomurus purpureus]